MNLTPTLQIVTNDGPFITPGSGSTLAKQYANSPDVLSGGVIGVGQMIAIEQADTNTAFLGLCTGTLINPRTVITAAHCLYNAPKEYYGSNTGTGGGLFGNVAKGLGKTSGIPLSFGFSATNRCINTNGCASGHGSVRGLARQRLQRRSRTSTSIMRTRSGTVAPRSRLRSVAAENSAMRTLRSSRSIRTCRTSRPGPCCSRRWTDRRMPRL